MLDQQASPGQIEYPRLRELIEHGGQLVEVLPPAEFQALHLPRAVNIPLKRLDAETASILDRNRAVVVYCWDSL